MEKQAAGKFVTWGQPRAMKKKETEEKTLCDARQKNIGEVSV